MNRKNNSNKAKRVTAFFIALLMLVESLIPSFSYALSGGPSQPEVEGFTPIGTTDMVDLFTGNFSYNIPLMDVDGYPINMGYQSGVSMDQEASWVGLGWNLNPGSINRSMRGVPDDFNGDEIVKTTFTKPSWTIGLNGAIDTKAFGFKFAQATVGLNLELFYNNYKGFGANFAPNWNVNFSKESEQAATGEDIENDKNAKAEQEANSKKKKFTATDILKNTFKGMYQNALGQIPGVGLISTKKQLTTSNKETLLKTTRSVTSNGISKTVSQVSAYFPNGAGYLPKLSSNMQTQNYSFDMNFGAATAGIFGASTVKVHVNWEGIDGNNTISKKAYGANYYDNNNSANTDILLDFNREKDGEYSKNKPFLPMPVSTYDIYSISGHGVGGMFRSMRNGIAIFHDDEGTSRSVGVGGQLEFGAATDAHIEGNVVFRYSTVKTGKWGNKFTNRIDDVSGLTDAGALSNYTKYEPNYFKITGEKNAVNSSLIYNKNIGLAYKPKIFKEHLFKIEAQEIVKSDDAGNDEILSNAFGNNLYDANRVVKNQYISTLTFDESEAFQDPVFQSGSFLPRPLYYLSSNAVNNNINIIDQISGPSDVTYYDKTNTNNKRKGHHIGEITLNQTNGSRYVYGIAAYNNEQTEYTINIGSVATNPSDHDRTTFNTQTVNTKTNIVDISATVDDYIEAGKGNMNNSQSDGYYNSIKTPGFAHSYLLTSILQPDYVDIAPKGTGPEDLGNYTKFNYVRTASEFAWRTPSLRGKATFIEGLKSQSHDNKASFVEGTKELWYLQTIESKNHVAVFVTERRQDAMAIKADDASANTSNDYSYCLKRIVLFTRQEYEKHIDNPLRDATPIKTVWFNYDYSLCQGVHNSAVASSTNSVDENKKGKLTLTDIYFTYGRSVKKINAYKFKYESLNPNYNQSNVDRWGNYKRDPITGQTNTYLNEPNNIDFPYVKQNKTEADENATAWSLTKINLPSGGIININYESDDYAYVQNIRAAQMMKLAAVGSGTEFPTSNKNVLYDNGLTSIDNSNYLFFPIPSGYSTAQATFYMQQCTDQLKQISFKVLMGIRENSDHEWVTGYASVQSVGLSTGTDAGKYFYVQIKNEDLESRVSSSVVNPITKAGLNFAKGSLPFVVNPNSFGDMVNGNASVQDYAYKILGLGSIVETLFGVNDRLVSNGFCKYIELGQSYFRLNEPFKKKLGGGSRVKKITINDAWADISEVSGTSQEFGQEFDYTTEELNGTITRTISSGVAAYEPGAGAEENPFRMPIGFKKESFLSPDEDEMIEGPMGESFFPSPNVGYSKVTVTNIGRVNAGNSDEVVISHGVGKTVTQFYTTKDFPILVNHTAITDERYWVPMIDLFIYKTQFENKYVSQGFSVQCNDMDGKQKSVEVFKQQNPGETTPKLLTGTYYKYRTNKNNRNQLDNSNMTVIDDQGNVSLKTMGVEAEMYADTRQKISESNSDALEMNFEIITICFGIPIIPMVPKFEDTEDEFYSTTLNRVSTAYGFIEETKVIQDGSEITTRNLAYDALTGDAVVTQTTNEYKKDVYNTTYPAHWIYDYMGAGYKNIGIGFKNVNLTSGGNIDLETGIVESDFLCKGDEVLIKTGSTSFSAVIDKDGSNFKLFGLLDGLAITSIPANFYMKIVRSGRRNMQSSPIFSATTLEKPFTGSLLNIGYDKNILDAKATTYQIDESKYMSFAENKMYLSSIYVEPYDVQELIKVMNYLIPKANLKLNASQFTSINPSLLQYVYNIPTDILSSDNIYTRSFVYKNIQKNLGKSFGHALVIRYQGGGTPEAFQLFFKFETTGAPNYFIAISGNSNFGQSNTFNNTHVLSGIKFGEVKIAGTEHKPMDCINNFIADGNIYCKAIDFFSFEKPVLTPYYNSGSTTNSIINGYYGTEQGAGACYAAYNIEAELNNSDYKLNALESQTKCVVVKPETSLLFKGNRITSSTAEKFANSKGVYDNNYANFYNLSTKQIYAFNDPASKWKVAETSTLFDPYTGTEVESKDALDRYRSVVYLKDQYVSNFKQQYANGEHYGISNKPQLYVENAKQSEVTTFNFETENELRALYEPGVTFNVTDKHYFERIVNEPSFAANISSAITGHTGKSALLLPKITSPATQSNIAGNFYIAQNYPSNSNNAIMPFYPKIGKKYIISGWVKTNNKFFESTKINAVCKVDILNKSRINVLSSFTFSPNGPIIDGWQRFEGAFEMANGTISGVATDAYVLKITLQNNSTTQDVYFDDLRIHPSDANIKNYIYDEQHRVKAILDENNYATFYEYNLRGELVSVRRETEKGIVTIQENRKNNSNVQKAD